MIEKLKSEISLVSMPNGSYSLPITVYIPIYSAFGIINNNNNKHLSL